MCAVVQPMENFYRRGGTRQGVQPYCRPCFKIRNRANHASRRDEVKARRLEVRYGLSSARFEEILQAQGGGCAVCGTTDSDGRWPRLQVDHDHRCCPGYKSCGRCVRGLLCFGCNSLLGRASDDPDRLEALARYLREGVASWRSSP